MEEHIAGQDLELSMADIQGGKWDHFTTYLSCREPRDTRCFSFPQVLFSFWLLPETHSAFCLKAPCLVNAVLVSHGDIAFHFSVKNPSSSRPVLNELGHCYFPLC